MGKKAKYHSAVIAVDVIGFAIVFLGAYLVRFSKDEVLAIVGGLVMAAGAAILGITRYMLP